MNVAGEYRLQPGAEPSIEGSRPVLGGARLAQWLRGQSGEAVVTRLGMLLTLCAHAQRHTARLALEAAQHQAQASPSTAAAQWLELETARDHLRSMALEWPHRQGLALPQSAWLDWLAACPLPLVASDPRARPDAAETLRRPWCEWLQSAVLQMPVERWLHEFRESDALAAWCAQAADRATPLQCLASWNPMAARLSVPLRALSPLQGDRATREHALRELAQRLQSDVDFALAPVWQGECAETGPWTRHRQAPAVDAQFSARSRLQSRWTEMLELAQGSSPQTPRLLESGALPLGDGQAIAWCEMARGLLLHWVQLDAEHRVQDYRVLAPTEWNFHPQGALAKRLSQLEAHDSARATCLLSAFDPCVECRVIVREGGDA
jgi:hypothetical protein